VEAARFVLMAVGTFLSVTSLSFAAFKHWRRRQDERFDALRAAMEKAAEEESADRRDSFAHLRGRIEAIEAGKAAWGREFEGRLGRIEGELKGIRGTLDKIQQWFIDGAGKN